MSQFKHLISSSLDQPHFYRRCCILTGHIRDTFSEVADISESLSTDSFSLTRILVWSALLMPLAFSFVSRSEEERVSASSMVVTNPYRKGEGVRGKE